MLLCQQRYYGFNFIANETNPILFIFILSCRLRTTYETQQQPVVDFSAGSECAEPSIALQDASLLCFHRKDVAQGVCALAADGYGELAENNNDEKKDIDSDANNDLGEFLTKPSSSSFVLPNPPEVSGTTTTEEKKDESTNANGEPEISATSAVVRGDRLADKVLIAADRKVADI